MKILIVFNHPAPYKVNLYNEINKKLPLEVIFERKTASNRDEKFYALNKYEFDHIFLKRGAFGEEQTNTNELVKILKHNKYDLIIMNGYSNITELKAISWMNRHHIKWVLFINGGIIKQENFIKRHIKQKYISSASWYFSPCEQADEYLRYYGAKQDKIMHYPNSTIFKSQLINKPLNNDEKNELRKQLGLPLNKKIFISPCQFISRKNNFQLLSNFKGRDEVLLLIGSGPEKEQYLTYIKQNKMDNVIILPYKDSNELPKYYQASNCFITLSKEDIYGHTTNEAMSQGIPAISSNNVVASLYLIKDNVNGFVVNLNNNDEIQHAISNVNDSMYVPALKTALDNTIETSSEVLVNHILRILNK